MTQISPYLNFNNNCREAMNFYQECLGGELNLQTVGEMPEMAVMMPPDFKDKILHSQLTKGQLVIMASDLSGTERIEGNTMQLCIVCSTEDEINSFFNNLAAGGKIKDSLKDMPWGAKFGSLTDKFGKHWLFNFDKNQG